MPDQPPTFRDPALRVYHDRAAEESRLEAGPSRLEEFRSRQLIQRRAPERPAGVLEIGGAAGAYSFW